MKRVVAEMGGKDAIVVADDADLDEAAAGIVFGGIRFSRGRNVRLVRGLSLTKKFIVN